MNPDGTAEMQIDPNTGKHTGRPVVRRTGYGRIMVLCPAGHLVQTIAEGDWAGSFLQARVHEPDYTVTCGGALTVGQKAGVSHAS